MMIEILRAGGFTTGGMNFDAKIRRQSIEPDDLLHAHVGSMDATAKALLNAAAIIEDGALQKFVDERYSGWGGALGKDILAGRKSLSDLATYIDEKKLEPQPKSGRQEYLENLVNRFS
jgi:xylose isomerase